MDQEQEGSIAWPEAIKPGAEEKLRKAVATPLLPEAILEVMEEELKESDGDSDIARTPSGEISSEFVGYVGFINSMQRAYRLFRSEEARLSVVKSANELQGILKQRFGEDVSRILYKEDPIERRKQEYDLLKDDPSGLIFADYVVADISREGEERQKGVMAAAERYKTLHDIALGT